MNRRIVTVGELELVEPLVQAYPFKPYRNYRVFSRKAQHAVMMAEIADTLGHADGIVSSVDQGGDRAIAVGRTLGWDSQFFDVPMGRIEYLLAPTPALTGAVLGDTVEHFRSRGVKHISARVDVADIESIGIYEANGFRLMDSLVTYITRPGKEPPNAVKEVGTIRPFRPEDAEALVEITGEAYAGFRGRFHLDPNLAKERADAFYVEWARQCVGSRMADMILVSEGADGRILGYLAFRRREPVSTAGGAPVFGGGLGACRSDAPGAYAGLIRAGTIWAHERDGVAECQTQNYNFPVVRIYEAVGSHYVRAEHTLHRWLS